MARPKQLREQYTRLCAFCSDGASVMTGRLSRVAVRLMHHSPRMIAIHCVNHRLALAAAHASDAIPYLQQFKSILQTLFYFYQNCTLDTIISDHNRFVETTVEMQQPS